MIKNSTEEIMADRDRTSCTLIVLELRPLITVSQMTPTSEITIVMKANTSLLKRLASLHSPMLPSNKLCTSVDNSVVFKKLLSCSSISVEIGLELQKDCPACGLK